MQMSMRTTTEGGTTEIHVAGALGMPGVPLLHDLVERAQPDLVIDLTELVSVDSAGLDELCEAIQQGAEIRNASRYVAMRIAEQRVGTANEPAGDVSPEGRELR